MRDYISFRHVEAPVKYLEKIGDRALWEMADLYTPKGYRVWAIQNLRPECLRRATQRTEYYNPLPLDDDLMRLLDDIEPGA